MVVFVMNNFDEHIDRKNTGAFKWDHMKDLYGRDDLLPMWVADMDFPSPIGVQKALLDRVMHPVYGYTAPMPTLLPVIQTWLKNRHSWEVDKDHLSFSAGVVSAIGMTIQGLTEPGDKILLQSPIYTPFFSMIEQNNRVVVNSQLKVIDDRFEIDFIDFEEKLKEGVKLFLLCSPHNPGGRIWTKEELTRMGELCLKYGTIIVSDEIHADLFHSSYTHYPLASLNERYADQTVTLMAPSKTFNIAGMQASIMITSNKNIRTKITTTQTRNAFHGLNILGLTAMEAAYRTGETWLDEMLAYVETNVKIAEDFIAHEIPGLRCMHPEASYLLWIDCRGLGLSDEEIQELLTSKGKLALEPGAKYGPGGEGFVRMNIGCPRTLLEDGLNRLKQAFS